MLDEIDDRTTDIKGQKDVIFCGGGWCGKGGKRRAETERR